MDLKKSIFIAALLLILCVSLIGCAETNQEEMLPNLEAESSPTLIPAATPEATATPTPTPDPTPTPYSELREGDEGEAVREMQEALAELGYFSEDSEMGKFDSATWTAVVLFQRQNGLQPDGIAGAETQSLLYSEDAKECDVFLKLAPTVGMTFEELVMSDDGTRDQYPEGYPEPGTYKIIVDIAHQVTLVYTQDGNGEYTVPVRYMLCSTGKDDCTPKGTFSMDNYRVRFSQFARDKTYGQYWSQIRGAIYFHTILYDEFDTSTYIEEVWEKLGTADSHGCIRLTVPDAKWIWFNIPPGTECVVRDGDPDDAETAAIREQLVLASLPEEHLSIDPQDIPNTDIWRIEDVAHDIPFVQGSQD